MDKAEFIFIKYAQRTKNPNYFKREEITKEKFDKLHKNPGNEYPSTSLFKGRNGENVYVTANSDWQNGAVPPQNTQYNYNAVDSLIGYNNKLEKTLGADYKKSLIDWNVDHKPKSNGNNLKIDINTPTKIVQNYNR